MNLKPLLLATALMTAAAAVATPAAAWDHLGTRDVRDAVDRDTISLPGARRFDRIRLCVYERPVHFIDVTVRFANGARQDVPVRARLRPGECTRAVDLIGDDRNITAVDMVYEANTRRRGVGAQVRLFGE
jgi:hypothetical protein